MKVRSHLHLAVSLATLGLALLMGSSSALAQQQDSERVSQLLVDARSYAVQAEDDAAALDAYARSSRAFKSMVSKLDSMKKHVNNMGLVAKELSELSAEASPWQRQAITEIGPLLRDMADHLGGTINYLNEHQSAVHMPPFREYVQRNHALAEQTAEMIKDYVKYDEAKSAAESLEQKLEIAEK